MLDTKGIIEALLFTWGDPLDIKSISSILEMDEFMIENILEEMIEDFDKEKRGLKIIKLNNSYQIGTRIEHFDYIKKYVDEIIPEENWEQKRTDIKKYDIDTFVIGDDWRGKFDFLKNR